jgi:hypothetical protein
MFSFLAQQAEEKVKVTEIFTQIEEESCTMFTENFSISSAYFFQFVELTLHVKIC